jgi:hypothetical protein
VDEAGSEVNEVIDRFYPRRRNDEVQYALANGEL